MHYVCIENNTVVSILNYEPNVPNTVTLVTITDEQHNNIQAETHYFDLPTKSVKPVAASVTAQKQTEQQNGLERDFLNSTDWQVLRHLRQKALGIATTLTDDEYLALERQRQQAAQRII